MSIADTDIVDDTLYDAPFAEPEFLPSDEPRVGLPLKACTVNDVRLASLPRRAKLDPREGLDLTNGERIDT